ncbi:putative carboxylic ester hydrolase [Ascoidea rubescens DSM 1968]|uniref:DDHD-domain-containing protein n=1 Tax=Ascoidea rubescens DSM 1968 TaxID=1344418 RepID=A0A1D2VBK3_9ASCO|nr:DDHD-domain-containing protein [Ascoidea rubescens DSM 1968]ODV58991.1 DDHD-domain-containing protein [Ascoidea rubescens DSM 1968]
MIKSSFSLTGRFQFRLFATCSFVLTSKSIPKIDPKWLYATDIPITKPKYYNYKQTQQPKNFILFSDNDSINLEKTFNLLKSGKGHLDSSIVTVNEDNLFKVDFGTQTSDSNGNNHHLIKMGPIYWDGPIYEVRRGTWFDSEGSPFNPKISAQLEDAYLSIKPYKRENSADFDNLEKSNLFPLENLSDNEIKIFGRYILFLNSTTACLLPDKSFLSKIQLNIVKSLSLNIPTFSDIKIIYRGYANIKKPHDSMSTNSSKSIGELKPTEDSNQNLDQKKKETEELNEVQEDEKLTEAMRVEIESDYNDDKECHNPYDCNDREVDHLILCVHGIGQLLGTRYQYINFVHTINVLRKSLKRVYSKNPQFQEIAYPNYEKYSENESMDERLISEMKHNCRIQVLPIFWRHKIDFESAKKDLKLPSLSDISIGGVKQIRDLVGDVLLDVLLYYDPFYFNAILNEVTTEANRIYDLYSKYNPKFKGKVSIIGHSLGSAITFEILSKQPEQLENKNNQGKLNFPVDNFFALGSPTGLFNLIKRKKIGSRQIYNLDNTENIMSLPRCNNYYNIFHPSDPVAYRVEPLISRTYSEFMPCSIPNLLDNPLDSIKQQLESITNISEKFVEKAANALELKFGSTVEKKEQKEDFDEKKSNKVKISKDSFDIMKGCNYSGRVDYALSEGYFDISIISAIGSHVSYFEDENVAGFLLKELLTKNKNDLREYAKLNK